MYVCMYVRLPVYLSVCLSVRLCLRVPISSLSCLVSFAVLYIFWLPLTCTGKLRRRRRRRLVVPSDGSGGIGSTQYGAGSGSYSYDLIEQQEDGADGEDTDGIDSGAYVHVSRQLKMQWRGSFLCFSSEHSPIVWQ